MFSVRGTRGSNGAVERAGGQARRQVYQALHAEAPFGARKSTSTTRNDLDFYNTEDAGCRRGFALSDSSQKDLVTIGRDVANGPDPCRPRGSP